MAAKLRIYPLVFSDFIIAFMMEYDFTQIGYLIFKQGNKSYVSDFRKFKNMTFYCYRITFNSAA